MYIAPTTTEVQCSMGWELFLAGLPLAGARELIEDEEARLRGEALLTKWLSIIVFVAGVACLALSLRTSSVDGVLFVIAFLLGLTWIGVVQRGSALKGILSNRFVYQFEGHLPERRLWSREHKRLAKIVGNSSDPSGSFKLECYPDGRILGQRYISCFDWPYRIKIKNLAPVVPPTGQLTRHLSPMERQEMGKYVVDYLSWFIVAIFVVGFGSSIYKLLRNDWGALLFIWAMLFVSFWIGSGRTIRGTKNFFAILAARRRNEIHESEDGTQTFLAYTNIVWTEDGQPAPWRYDLRG